MVVRFAGSYIIKSSDAPRASAGKGGSVGSGKLANHSDLLQVQDLVSFTHHAFDRQFKKSDCDYQRPTHSLVSCSENGDGAVKGSQMGQISEVHRSLVDIWKRDCRSGVRPAGPFLFAGFAECRCLADYAGVVRICVPILCYDEAVVVL